MLWHDYIPDYLKPVLASYLFEDAEKHIASTPGGKQRLSSVTTAGHKVEIIEPVAALQATWHRAALYRRDPSYPTLANCARPGSPATRGCRWGGRMGHPAFWTNWGKSKTKAGAPGPISLLNAVVLDEPRQILWLDVGVSRSAFNRLHIADKCTLTQAGHVY